MVQKRWAAASEMRRRRTEPSAGLPLPRVLRGCLPVSRSTEGPRGRLRAVRDWTPGSTGVSRAAGQTCSLGRDLGQRHDAPPLRVPAHGRWEVTCVVCSPGNHCCTVYFHGPNCCKDLTREGSHRICLFDVWPVSPRGMPSGSMPVVPGVRMHLLSKAAYYSTVDAGASCFSTYPVMGTS